MSNKFFFALTVFAIVTVIAVGVKAENILNNVELSGSVGLESRAFLPKPGYNRQFSGVQNSLFIEPEIEWESNSGDYQISFIPYTRLDARDNNRTHYDIREAYVRYVGDEVEVLAGLNRVFWGVTESRHLVNVINQIDTVENIDEEDFLGQPMINLASQQDYGRFELFVLPGFRERTFGDANSRLSGPLYVADEQAQYESGAEEKHVDFALRYSHYIGNWDIGLSAFHGTGREPTLRLSPAGNALIAHYDIITQLGTDLQYTLDEWLWKFEGIVREGHGDTFAAMIGGVEYTYFQVLDTDADLGLLAEYQYDGRDEINAPSTIAQNDVFLGTRLTLNDVDDTSLLAGGTIDVEDQSSSARLEAETRLSDNMKIEAEMQLFFNQDDRNLSYGFRDDDFALLRLAYYF